MLLVRMRIAIAATGLNLQNPNHKYDTTQVLGSPTTKALNKTVLTTEVGRTLFGWGQWAKSQITHQVGNTVGSQRLLNLKCEMRENCTRGISYPNVYGDKFQEDSTTNHLQNSTSS